MNLVKTAGQRIRRENPELQNARNILAVAIARRVKKDNATNQKAVEDALAAVHALEEKSGVEQAASLVQVCEQQTDYKIRSLSWWKRILLKL